MSCATFLYFLLFFCDKTMYCCKNPLNCVIKLDEIRKYNKNELSRPKITHIKSVVLIRFVFIFIKMENNLSGRFLKSFSYTQDKKYLQDLMFKQKKSSHAGNIFDHIFFNIYLKLSYMS